MKPKWRSCEGFFMVDGALRDICILGTDLRDWEKMLASLDRSGRKLRFFVVWEEQPLPGRAREILELATNELVLLKIEARFGDLHCHFFGEEGIELDFLPGEISSATKFEDLLEFMRLVGTAVEKPVLLSQENWPEASLLTYHPDKDDFELGAWFAPGDGRA